MDNIPKIFSWSQTDNEVTILFRQKYFEFVWFASTCAGPFPLMKDSEIKVSFEEYHLFIIIPQFCFPIFAQKFQESFKSFTWKYIPKQGIEFIVIKKQFGKVWKQPFDKQDQCNAVELQYRIANSMNAQNRKLEYEMLSKNVRKISITFEEMEKRAHQTFQIYEDSISNLRKGYGLKYFVDGHNQSEGIQSQQLVNSNLNFNDASKKISIFQDIDHFRLKPVYLSEIEFGLNEKTMVLTKTYVKSIKAVGHQTVIVDSFKYPLKLSIYNLQNNTIIQKDTWILIKEPFLKFGARDHCPLIRVDNVKDLIFNADQLFIKDKIEFKKEFSDKEKGRIQIINDQIKRSLVFQVNIKSLIFIFYAFSWDKQLGNKKIFLKRGDSWIGATINSELSIGENMYQIKLVDQVQSLIFIEGIKNIIDKEPGDLIELWKPFDVSIEGIVEYILWSNKILNNGKQYFSSLMAQKCELEDVFLFWEKSKDSILEKEEESKEIEQNQCKSNKKNKSKNKNKKKKSSNQNKPKKSKDQNEKISAQIIEILENFFGLKAAENSKLELPAIHFNEPLTYEQLPIQTESGQIFEKGVLLDAHQILNNLLEEKNEVIVKSSIFYLMTFKEQIVKSQSKDREEFSTWIVENKISPKDIVFDLPNSIQSLKLIDMPVSSQVVIQIMRAKEREQLDKLIKEKVEIEQNIEEQKNDIDFFTEAKDIQEIKDEFWIKFEDLSDDETEDIQVANLDSNINSIKNQEEDQISNKNNVSVDEILSNNSGEDIQSVSDKEFRSLDSQSENTKDPIEEIYKKQTNQKKEDCNFEKKQEKQNEDNQSLQSKLTVHSSLTLQALNDHWKGRLEQRYKINIRDKFIRETIRSELKLILLDPASKVIQSQKQKDRYLVKHSKRGICFVLQKCKSISSNKDVYIPITVLSPWMKFK